MTNPLVVIGLIVAGFFVGNFLSFAIGFLEKNTFPGTSENWYNIIIGWIYFACLFSIPMSGNIPLFIMTAGMFFYALYGSFGKEKLKPLKQEDKVFTKWYSGFP
ncbi:MAG: hypothetical protein GOU98_02195 [Candidatus Altiarchaeota archaeon]|nr:hypothetical protein [Candidatus Altiarchaeota archaeon]